MNHEVYRKVVDWLRETSVRSQSITPDTEIYADLGLYGDDLYVELPLWIEREFGVQIDKPGNYAPGEVSFFFFKEAFRKLIGRAGREYESLKVRDVVQAIEAACERPSA